ncbi:hypothetical protein WN943_006255 [Citrus x changshan-huyou]
MTREVVGESGRAKVTIVWWPIGLWCHLRRPRERQRVLAGTIEVAGLGRSEATVEATVCKWCFLESEHARDGYGFVAMLGAVTMAVRARLLGGWSKVAMESEWLEVRVAVLGAVGEKAAGQRGGKTPTVAMHHHRWPVEQ